MAEGYAKTVGRGKCQVYSAGLEPSQVSPYAIQVMKEIGIDISQQKSKELDNELLRQMDVIVTLCDNAKESCPVTPPGIYALHWSLPDPSRLTGSQEEIQSGFRSIRDEIRNKIEELLKLLGTGSRIQSD